MSRDFQQTHENLLACAKKHFLENGFERASIREICKADSVIKHFELARTDELKQLWKLSEDTIRQIIEYIYEHFDVFKLLLMQSAGTKYASFLDDVVRSDVRETQKLIAELKERGVPVHDLEDDEWHMLVHSYYSSIAEIVLHNYPKDAAIKYAHTLAAFFSSGWQTVLGI